MPTRIAINGMGRMGRLCLRTLFDRHLEQELELVAVNEIKGGAAATAHLLKYDSIKGRWGFDCQASEDGQTIVIDGKHSLVFSEATAITKLDWTALKIDVVLECTGKFLTTRSLAEYFTLGVKKVIVSAPVKEEGVLNIVQGVNHDAYDPAKHNIITAASCTTNCLAPMDFRRARSCLTSLVPTTTGSATAIATIFPELKGKLNGIAVRVPLLNASITDAVFEVSRPTTKEEVNALFKAVADKDTPLGKVLGYSELELVGEDYRCDPRSCVVDASSTMVVDGTQVKVVGWYDNEQGYVYRMVDLALMVAARV
ncbi:hypothetical protein HDU93_008807 [Gonapodya sp. JEL0774]|nr:hypothetical protein HDU93_008807 [Gonapodya sp. JEL0774]